MNRSIFVNFPILETRRLTLREPNIDDLNDMLITLSDEEVMKYMGIDLAKTLEDVKNEFKWYKDIYQNKSGIRWAIAQSNSNIMIGSCGFKNYDSFDNKAEIGYELRKEYWRQGIMTEALESIIEFGFNELDLNRISAEVDTRNISSLNLLLKLGFQMEGIMRESEYENEKYIDLALLSILKREYLKENHV